VCWGDKSIGSRFRNGQRGPANPPEDLTICRVQRRHYEVRCASKVCVSEFLCVYVRCNRDTMRGGVPRGLPCHLRVLIHTHTCVCVW
jgi:hypothetical protein